LAVSNGVTEAEFLDMLSCQLVSEVRSFIDDQLVCCLTLGWKPVTSKYSKCVNSKKVKKYRQVIKRRSEIEESKQNPPFKKYCCFTIFSQSFISKWFLSVNKYHRPCSHHVKDHWKKESS